MDEPSVLGIAGSGPGAEAVEAAATDVDAEVTTISATAADTVDLAVIVAPAGRAAFDRANRAAEAPWIAVELGGIGGRSFEAVEAAVSVLTPTGGCFDCLRQRVESTAEEAEEGPSTTSRAAARLAGAHAGRLATGLFAGTAGPGRVIELPYVERALLPVPGCRCTTPIDRTLDRTAASVDLETTVDRMERAVDDRLGPVTALGEAHSFPAPYYLATLCDTTTFADTAAGPQAAGVAADWNEAFVKAVGEALERYGAGVYRASTFVGGTAAERTGAIRPSAFVRPTEMATVNDSPSLRWVPGESLHDGRSVWLPAEFVVFPPPTERLAPAITTGLGLGTSGIGAILSGLYEVIERDATMLAWYSTFEPLGVQVEDPMFATLARRARAEDLTVTPLLVTQDVDVPVIAVAVHREKEWPRFAVGSGAALDPGRAARSALAEAIQNWMELRAMGPEQAAEDDSEIAHYAAFPDEVRAFVAPSTAVPLADLGPTDPPSGPDELTAVTDRLEAVGLEAYAARRTTPDLVALDLEVVRVVVPGAQPLFTGVAFFGDRAQSVPSSLGFEPRLDRDHHPYP